MSVLILCFSKIISADCVCCFFLIAGLQQSFFCNSGNMSRAAWLLRYVLVGSVITDRSLQSSHSSSNLAKLSPLRLGIPTLPHSGCSILDCIMLTCYPSLHHHIYMRHVRKMVFCNCVPLKGLFLKNGLADKKQAIVNKILRLLKCKPLGSSEMTNGSIY